MVAALEDFDARLLGCCLGIDTDNGYLPIANGRWLSYEQELSEHETLRVTF